MPILAEEPCLWPDDLLQRDDPGDCGDEWLAFHVRPRTEKALARRLHRHRISFFLPLHENRRVYQRRVVHSLLPLFPGYVFVCGGEQALAASLYSQEVVSRLEIPDQQRFHHDLQKIHRMIESGSPLTREERLEPGMPARIIAGSLSGLTGVIIRNDNGLRFVMEVRFLQQGVSLEVDGAMIEAL